MRLCTKHAQQWASGDTRRRERSSGKQKLSRGLFSWPCVVRETVICTRYHLCCCFTRLVICRDKNPSPWISPELYPVLCACFAFAGFIYWILNACFFPLPLYLCCLWPCLIAWVTDPRRVNTIQWVYIFNASWKSAERQRGDFVCRPHGQTLGIWEQFMCRQGWCQPIEDYREGGGMESILGTRFLSCGELIVKEAFYVDFDLCYNIESLVKSVLIQWRLNSLHELIVNGLWLQNRTSKRAQWILFLANPQRLVLQLLLCFPAASNNICVVQCIGDASEH